VKKAIMQEEESKTLPDEGNTTNNKPGGAGRHAANSRKLLVALDGLKSISGLSPNIYNTKR
jgi:hypothetical protein